MSADEQAIRAAHRRWIEAVNAGDLDCLLGLMAKDATFLGPGQAPIGRADFPAGFRQAHTNSRIRCTSELEEVVIAGELAYTRSRDSLSVQPWTGGAAVELTGHRVSLYRRQSDGPWLLACDAHTLSPLAN